MCEHRINLTKAKLKTHENINTNKCTCTWSYQPQSLLFSKAFFYYYRVSIYKALF